MLKTDEGSTGRLVQLCAGYFVFYAITGVAVKYFTGKASAGFPGMHDMQYLVYSTAGGSAICLAWVLARRWYRLKSARTIALGPIAVPAELLYIVPSGVCTAVIIPTTTLMYMLPISVMVAMVIMRASVIVISRLVDAAQIRQGILQKKVYRTEDLAVLFALFAVATQVFGVGPGGFDFIRSPAAIAILGSYIVAYAFRIYIMNYFKNTRGKGVPLDNQGFFALEQIAASVAMAIAASALFAAGAEGGPKALAIFRGAIVEPRPLWGWATLSGVAYGIVAFFSVFIFMFKGRTATFAGLVNRLTSLIAGTAATLIFHFGFGGKFPKREDWLSLTLILVAVGFLTIAERRRARELAAARAASPVSGAPPPLGAPQASAERR